MKIICAGAIFNQDNKILLQLRDDKKGIDDPNIWTFPGGEKTNDESIESALVREIYEETNLKVVSSRLVCTKKVAGKKLIYFFNVIIYNFENMVCREGQELKFFAKNELQSLNKYKYFYDFYNLI